MLTLKRQCVGFRGIQWWGCKLQPTYYPSSQSPLYRWLLKLQQTWKPLSRVSVFCPFLATVQTWRCNIVDQLPPDSFSSNEHATILNSRWLYTTKNIIMNIVFNFCWYIRINPAYCTCSSCSQRKWRSPRTLFESRKPQMSFLTCSTCTAWQISVHGIVSAVINSRMKKCSENKKCQTQLMCDVLSCFWKCRLSIFSLKVLMCDLRYPSSLNLHLSKMAITHSPSVLWH